MGQSTSRPSSSANSPQNASPNTQPTRKAPKRKESAGGLAPKGSTVAPVPSLESAIGQSSQAQSQPQQHTQSQPGATHSRGRSQTIPAPHSTPLDGTPLDSKPKTENSTAARSVPRPVLNIGTSSPASADLASARIADPILSGQEDLPASFYGAFSQFGRPPRLPLPIEEEQLEPGSPAPGSPTITPGDFEQDQNAGDDGVPRSRSVLSAVTLDEDDEVEDVIYRADKMEGPLVDTLIEWKEGGERVYLTGTFCGWAKKSRLHKNGPSKDPDAFSAIIGLPPGTLYLAFLVDGVPRTARHLPTTVDYTNVLVNYLRIPPETTLQPVIPGDAGRMQHEGPGSPEDQHNQPPMTGSKAAMPDVRPATASDVQLVTPQATLPVRTSSKKQKPTQPTPAEPEAKPKPAPERKKKADTREYHSQIPSFLLDWDAPENSSRVRRANAVSSTHQAPPQLPPYLQKSILSTATPMKDDASVLVLPNHTVLNHLATSSIKDGVLGTSATTRYKKKFVTTIMYMPTNSIGS